MKKATILVLIALAVSLVPASATVPLVQIQVPKQVTEGDEVTVEINITHRNNDKNHHINYVWLYQNNEKVDEWTWTRDNFVTEDTFTLTHTTILWEDAVFLAHVHCTLHGSEKVTAKVDVLPFVEKPRAILLANAIDYTRASSLVTFLEENGFEVVHVGASEFGQYKTEELIIILGGADALDGVGAVVSSVLDDREQELTRLGMRYFLKTDVWTSNQQVFIFSGRDRDETKQAHEQYRDRILE